MKYIKDYFANKKIKKIDYNTKAMINYNGLFDGLVFDVFKL